VLSVDAHVSQVNARSVAFVRSSTTAAALVTVSGGMMDIGWADSASRSLTAIVDAHVGRVDAQQASDALAAAIEAELTELERREKWLCNVGFVLVCRVPAESSAWRVHRIGGARVYALRGNDVVVVGTEDVIALPHGGEHVVTAGLTSSVRWRAEQGDWVLHDEADAARQQRASLRSDTVNADAIVVVTCPHWAALSNDAISTSGAALGAMAGAGRASAASAVMTVRMAQTSARP
jgi:hypothetical protein